MRLLKEVVIRATGNYAAQEALNKVVYYAQSLRGVGQGRSVATSGEKGIIELLLDKYTSPFCVVDVGANRGQFLAMALNYLEKEEIYFHCFEPSAKAFEVLRERYASRRCISLNNVGLGKEAGEKQLYYDGLGATTSSFIQRKLSSLKQQRKTFERSETVRVESLDRYCAERRVETISLLKIDVEGFEMDVLEGAHELFANGRVEIASFEFGAHQIERRLYFHDFYVFFARNNMRLYRVTPSGYLHPLEKYREEYEQFKTSNYVAVLNK